MSKGHLKQIVSPKTWILSRKQDKFVIKPSPGPHPIRFSIPLGFLLKMQGFGMTAREIKKIINTKNVLVDNRRVKNPKFPVGIMDVVNVKETNDYFRVIFDTKGRLTVLPITADDAKIKLCKVKNKTVISGGKIQINLFDSRNILSDNNDIKTGDTLVIDISSKSVKEVIKFEKGVRALLTGGHHMGSIGTVKEIEKNAVVVDSEGVLFNTEKQFIFVVGKSKEVIKLR